MDRELLKGYLDDALSLDQIASRSLAELRREAAKCVLLCSCCHAEVEAGFSRI